jgi:hypothetical protein
VSTWDEQIRRCRPIGGSMAVVLAAAGKRVLLAALVALPGALLPALAVRADSSSEQLASYYDRHMVIRGGVAYGWSGSERPAPMISDVIQVGVGKDAYYALRKNGTLLTWSESPANAVVLMREVVSFAAGHSGWLAINRTRGLWQGSGREPPRKVAERVAAAAVGDGTDYYITPSGDLYVKGQANRGQYGDGRLLATSDFVKTASQVAAVRAHTGHALYLASNGEVFGTGGNVNGPLARHGLGDKAATWGSILAVPRASPPGPRIRSRFATTGRFGPGAVVLASSRQRSPTMSSPSPPATDRPSLCPATENCGPGTVAVDRARSRSIADARREPCPASRP